MAQQMVTRVTDQLAAQVDELIAAGVVANRSEAVRHGLEYLIDRHRRDQIGAAICRGYQASPQSDDDLSWSDTATVRMIADEPW